MKRAVELVRVSSTDQHERDTAQAQRDALDALRARRPAEVIARIDPPGAISASLPFAQRPDLAELRRLAERGFDELRVFDLTRLSRAESPVDRMAVLALVQSAGAIIVDCSGRELDPTRDEDELAYYVQTLFGRSERRKFVQRSASGKHSRASAGRIVGRLGFGYRALPRASKKDPPTYEIDPVQGPIVVEIFRRAIAGHGTRAISLWLMEQGITAARGGTYWSTTRVYDILRAETACGVFEQTVEGVKYRVEVPAIVSRETWEAAQAAIDGRFQTRGRPGTIPALCRGRAWCTCGSRVVVKSQSNGRGYGPRYMCSSRLARSQAPSCGAPSIRVDELDSYVWNELVRLIEDPSLLSEAANDSENERWAEQVEQCERTIEKSVRDEKRVLDLLRRDLLSDEAAADELKRIRTARHTAERSAELARKALGQRKRTVQPDAVNAFRSVIAGADFDAKRKIIEALVPETREHGVFISPDGEIELVGLVTTGAAEGPAGVIESSPSACSKTNPAIASPRTSRTCRCAASWCAPQSGMSRFGSCVPPSARLSR